MQTDYIKEQLLEDRVERVLTTIKRVVLGLFIAFLAIISLVLILEVKREYGIDLIKGVNFSIDDWYFDNIGNAVNSFKLF